MSSVSKLTHTCGKATLYQPEDEKTLSCRTHRMSHNGASWCKYSFFTSVVNKIVFVALVALFLSQVWTAYQKLTKRNVAYDQEVRSSMEQFYPSFTLCPEYETEGLMFNDIGHSIDEIFNYRKNIMDEMDFLTHIVKSEDG